MIIPIPSPLFLVSKIPIYPGFPPAADDLQDHATFSCGRFGDVWADSFQAFPLEFLAESEHPMENPVVRFGDFLGFNGG